MLLTRVARGDARVDSLVPTFSWEGVWRQGTSQPVEIVGKYTIRNNGDENVDLAGLALTLRFPGDVVVTSEDGEYSTNARARDWIFVCFWTFVEGSNDGSNACPNIDFVVKNDGTLEVRFIESVVLCPGCTLRGDSQHKSFVLKHSSYFGVVRDAADFLEIVGVDAYVDVPAPPPPKRAVCFPSDVDFSFRVCRTRRDSTTTRAKATATATRRLSVRLGTTPSFASFSTFEIDNRYPSPWTTSSFDSRSTGPSNRVQTTPRFVRTPTISFFDATARPLVSATLLDFREPKTPSRSPSRPDSPSARDAPCEAPVHRAPRLSSTHRFSSRWTWIPSEGPARFADDRATTTTRESIFNSILTRRLSTER